MTTNGHVPTRADLEAAGIRVLVAVPLERTIHHVAFLHLWQVAQRGWPLVDQGYARVDVNRHRAAMALLESDYTHLMMLDCDHLHPADIVERHARWAMLDPARRVISGLHFRRGAPFDPLVYMEDGRTLLHWPQGLIEAVAVGHGSILIHRSVFEAIEPPWWGYDYARVKEGIFPTEDLYFCQVCKEAGINIWVDTTTTSPHLIDNVVNETVFRGWLHEHPEVIGEVKDHDSRR